MIAQEHRAAQIAPECGQALKPGAALWEHPSFRAVAGETWRPGGLALTRRALDWCEARSLLVPGELVVDCGCGAGASLALLAQRGYHALGLDQRPDLPGADCASFAHPCFVRANLTSLPLRDACAGLLLFECVLSLVDAPQLALAEAWRVLRPGGVCLLADLTLRAGFARTIKPSGAASFSSCLDGARPEVGWQELLQEAGLQLLAQENHDHALAELAAKLLWYGQSDCLCSSGLGGLAGPRRRFGYGLWLAQRPTAQERKTRS